MNKDSFFQHIEEARDCEQNRLDMAVNKGLLRAKNDRVDPKKLFILAAASVFTFAMCFIVNMEPFRMAVEEYYRNWNETFPGSSQALAGYMNDIADNVIKHLGGEKCFY